jgi:hypothetical protein
MSGLADGTHTVSFMKIPGWTEPQEQGTDIVAGETTSLTRAYQQRTGSIRVIIAPEGARADGARWRVDTGPWQESGGTVSQLIPGQHTIAFLAISGWTIPEPQTVDLAPGQAMTLNGVYTESGGIHCYGGKPARRGLSGCLGDAMLLASAAMFLAIRHARPRFASRGALRLR